MDTLNYIGYTILIIEWLFLLDIYLSKQEQIKPILSLQNLISLNIILVRGTMIVLIIIDIKK